MATTSKTLGIIAAGLTLALAGAAWALDASTTKFLTDAIRGNLAEAKMGQLAQNHGQSKDVREFGKALMSERSIAFEKSSSLAEQLGVTAPVEMTAEAAKVYEAMSKLSAAEFDRQFAAHIVMQHEKDLDAYRDAAVKAGNPKVAAFAEEMLPTLKMHLAMAQSIDRGLKVAELARKGSANL